MTLVHRILHALSHRLLRLFAPLLALATLALATIVIAAQRGLAFCDNRIAMSGPMDGMTMPGDPHAAALMICPVALVLILTGAVLAAIAIVSIWLDPNRRTNARATARLLTRARRLPALAGLFLFSALALALMIAVDGNGIPSPAICAGLAALMLGFSWAAFACSSLTARLVLALTGGLLIAIMGAIAARSGPRKPFERRVPRAGSLGAARRFLATVRGLRAPPSFVR